MSNKEYNELLKAYWLYMASFLDTKKEIKSDEDTKKLVPSK